MMAGPASSLNRLSAGLAGLQLLLSCCHNVMTCIVQATETPLLSNAEAHLVHAGGVSQRPEA